MTPAKALRRIELEVPGGLFVLETRVLKPKTSAWTISSNLRAPVEKSDHHPFHTRQYNGAVDGIESLVLAHACAGVDVQSKEYLEGLASCCEAIASNLT